ncbi:MAG: endonuclease III [Clostridiaceae bacterium]|nr:endonuclease III [Clostridiaceae bacterium]
MLKQEQIKLTLEKLYEMYPSAECELRHTNSFELLISTVLSAQTTDKKVNQVTEKLYQEFKTPQDFVTLKQEELEGKIKEIGLYKSKAKHILSLCKVLIEKFNSTVPGTMEELIILDGVGRKTANVVLSNAFNIPAFAVDTHVFRVANRIGLSNGKDVTVVENQLMKKVPKELWIISHHTLIFHGRRICKARKPLCQECGVNNLCEFYNKSLLNKI